MKLPEKYEKCFRVSSSVNEKSLSTPPRGRKWVTSLTANSEGRGAARGQENFLSLGWETILEAK